MRSSMRLTLLRLRCLAEREPAFLFPDQCVSAAVPLLSTALRIVCKDAPIEPTTERGSDNYSSSNSERALDSAPRYFKLCRHHASVYHRDLVIIGSINTL